MYVTFPVSQRELLRAQQSGGQPDARSIKVRIRFADGTIYDQTGEINFLDVTVDRTTDTVIARATMSNPKGALIDGQLVSVVLEAAKQEEKIVIPQAALIADQQGVYIFVVEDGKVAIRRVKPGAASGTGVVIEEGLAGGEQVIVEGIQRVRPDSRYRRHRCLRPSAGAERMLSAIFVDRPRLAIVIAVVTTIGGLLSLFAIPIAQYPDIVPPQVSVTTNYPGASAAVVDATIAQPIEAQVVGVDKMIYMKSVSGNDGSYTLTASFELGTNPDINTVNVNNRVQVALSSLPEDVQRQGVTVKKKSSALLGVIAVYSPKQTHDPLFISNFVTINLLDQIKSTPGVGDATLWGPQDYAMRAWVKTDRLTGLGLTTGDVIKAIQAQNVQAAVGRIGARPISNEQQLQLNIETKGRLASVEEFENIVVRTNPDGSILRLRDIARLELGAANLDRETRLNGGAASAIAIYQSPGANAIATLKAVRGKVTELEKRFPEDLAWKVTYDPTTFVTDTIHEVKKTLGEAFVLVVIVVFLFLGSVRATLIPTLAVPVSLIGTFVALLAIGYSANTVSLLAIVLAIGIVVDDAIVVVENVERVMEEHPELSPAEATKRAMQEITAPIIAITLVLLSVFVPVAFIPGISGELFRQFAVTVAVSMFLSAINALTLSPALCGVLLRPHHGPRRGVMGMVMRTIDQVRDAYGVAVARIVRVSVIGLVLVAVAGAGVLGLAKFTPTGFLPEDDQGALFVIVQLPGASSVVRTSDVIRQAEEILKGEESVADYTSIIGLNFIDNYSESNAAFMVVTLKPFEERKDRSLAVPQVIARLGEKFRQIPGGHCGSARAAADPRTGYRWRLRLCAGGPAGRRSQTTGAGVARTDGRGQPGSAAQPGLQHVLGHQSFHLSQNRSRQGANSRCPTQRRVPVAAGLARRLLRQRHEICSAAAGRCRCRPKATTVRRSTTSTASMCATAKGR